jgi:hypothetical protein
MRFTTLMTRIFSVTCLLLTIVGARLNGQDSGSKLVSFLVNKNPKPNIPEFGVPDFPEDYDWTEYQRVIEVLKGASSKIDDDSWKELREHFEDEGYCTTVTTQNGKTINLTIGYVCRNLAAETLWAGYSNKIEPSRFEDRLKLRRLAGFKGLGDMKLLIEKSKDMSVYQLQMLTCREALKNADDLDIPDGERESWKKQIRLNLEQLEKSGKATKPKWFGPEQFEIFSKSIVESLRNSDR